MNNEVGMSSPSPGNKAGSSLKPSSIPTVSEVVHQILNNNSVPHTKKHPPEINNESSLKKESAQNSDTFEPDRSMAEEEEEEDSFDTDIRYPSQKPTVLNRTLSILDADLLERQELCSKEERRNSKEHLNDGFITKMDKDGNFQNVQVTYDDTNLSPVEDGMVNSIADFVSADIITKPFNFVSGNVRKARFNPFRKKSGLLNVLARQATRNRIVSKNGNINTIFTSEGKAHHFMKDFFITTLELSWMVTFFMFAFVFFFSWLLFAVIWYLTFTVHGDFHPDNKVNSSFIPCVSAIEDFTSCFLFSLETQHTIGYGGRATTEQCPVAIIVMSLQSILGVIIQACMAGIIFAKFTVPTARQETIVFSKNAVITLRNGHLFLLWRLADLRKASLLEAHVRTIIIQKERTVEGEIIPYYQEDLECGCEMDGTNDRVALMWPVIIGHKIDADSPMYEVGPRELLNSQMEIVCILEGITEETGNTVQVRTSYLPNEILWGHQFEHCTMAYDKKAGAYRVNHSVINRSIVDQTPRCSSKQLDERREKRTSALSSSTSGATSPKDEKKP